MKTKPTLTLILVCGLCWTSYGQKCKILKNEKDEFTGKRIIITDSQKIGNMEGTKSGSGLHASIMIIDTLVLLRMYPMNQDLGCASSDSKALFKLKSDSIITAPHVSEISCREYSSAYSFTPATITLPLSQQWATLQTADIKMIRLIFTKYSADYTINDGAIKNLFLCAKSGFK